MLLSDPIPLRSSESLRAFRQSGFLPWWYGDLRQSPQSVIQLSDTEFFVADHAMLGDIGVQIDGQSVAGFAPSLVALPDQPAYTIVTLAAPVPSGSAVTVTGRGLPHPRTGALMDNPADILASIMERSKYEPPDAKRAALTRLRAECAASGITIAGRVTARETLRATINSVVRSIGGAWSTRALWLHPSPRAIAVPSAMSETRLPEAVVTGCVAVREQSLDEIEIKFDDQSYQAEHRQAIVLQARASYAPRGTRKTMLAPWLRSPQVAQSVAERILARAAGRVFRLTIEAPEPSTQVEIGDVIAVESKMVPVAGRHWATVLGQERFDRRVSLIAEVIVPHADQRFAILSRTVASDVPQLPAVEVEIRDGNVRFTVFGDDGKPLARARVSLNGGVSKLSDANGLVIFPKPQTPGVYTLYVYRTGMVPIEIPVSIA